MYFNILYYHPFPAPKVRHNFNTSIGKYFKDKNQELVQELQHQYRKFQIPKNKKLLESNYLQEVITESFSSGGFRTIGCILAYIIANGTTNVEGSSIRPGARCYWLSNGNK